VILGDSHPKGCAVGVKHLLSNDFEVPGSINPGAGMKTIKDTASVKVQQLTKKDVVVLWGDSNDIARNNTLVGLKRILEFLISTNHTCDSAHCTTSA
jgi:acid phosphatase class B